MGIEPQPEHPQPVVEIVLPHRPAPGVGRSLEHLGAPDVVDQDVDVSVVGLEPPGQHAHLRHVEVVDLHGDAGTAQFRDQFGCFLDGLGPVVVGVAASASAAAPGAHHGRTDLAQRRGDAPARATGGPGDHRDVSP